jgi:hypothetical protein
MFRSPMTDYRMRHKAPSPLWNGLPLYRADVAFPGIEKCPGDYLHDEHYETAWLYVTRVLHKPDAVLTAYRFVPPGVTTISPGDWVTIVLEYAKAHGVHPDDQQRDWPVISMRVLASHLWTDGNDLCEWGYYPLGVPCSEDG